MAGRVDQVQVVGLPVGGPVLDPHGLRLDRDPALALEVHRVEHLRLHLLRVDRPGDLEDAVGQGRLAVVDVGDDREVADVVHGRAEYGDWPAGPVAAGGASGEPPGTAAPLHAPPRRPPRATRSVRSPASSASTEGSARGTSDGSSWPLSLKTTVGGMREDDRGARAFGPAGGRGRRACPVRSGRGWRRRSRSRRRRAGGARRGRWTGRRSRRGRALRRRTRPGWRGRCRTAGTGACSSSRSARRSGVAHSKAAFRPGAAKVGFA